jgi:hypothetical protein
MKEKFLPWFLLFCALGLSGTAAYYSVVGLAVVFVGVAIPVVIMGTFLEISKIAIATYLHEKWEETYGILKIYMTIALVTLSIITSLGIYGLLSLGFQENIAKLEVGQKKIKNIEVKKERFEEIKQELIKEKTTLDGDITKLREGLSNNTTTQTVDRKTGQLITKANNANRKTFELQLKDAQIRKDTISKKIDNFNDSITKLDLDILNMESEEISAGELGTIKYVSEILDWDVKKTANLFILILIFVFDPLAITLVIATNQAFKSVRKKENGGKRLLEKNVDKLNNNETNTQEENPTQSKNDEKIENNNVVDNLDSQIVSNSLSKINDFELDIITTKNEYETPQVVPQVIPQVSKIEEDTNIPHKEEKTQLQKEANKVWETVRELKEEGIFPKPTEEDIMNEPTALANSGYREKAELEEYEKETDQVPTEYRPSTDQVKKPEIINEKVNSEPSTNNKKNNDRVYYEPIVIERESLDLPDIDEKPWLETLTDVEQEKKIKRLTYRK